jgi:hypothetical protein
LARRGGLTTLHDAFVLEAELALEPGFDPAAVGAAVTTELCGHWEHEGPCRFPHNSAIDAERDPARFRTLFVADGDDADNVRSRVENVLREGTGWRLVTVRSRPVADDEAELAASLLAGPRSG